MNIILITFLTLALIDLVLTFVWIYRWNSHYTLRRFKHRIPIKLIEANHIVQASIKTLGLYTGLIVGYAILFIIQYALVNLHWILGLIVIAILLWANLGHIKNNLKTPKSYIFEITFEYNRKMNEKKS